MLSPEYGVYSAEEISLRARTLAIVVPRSIDALLGDGSQITPQDALPFSADYLFYQAKFLEVFLIQNPDQSIIRLAYHKYEDSFVDLREGDRRLFKDSISDKIDQLRQGGSELMPETYQLADNLQLIRDSLSDTGKPYNVPPAPWRNPIILFEDRIRQIENGKMGIGRN